MEGIWRAWLANRSSACVRIHSLRPVALAESAWREKLIPVPVAAFANSVEQTEAMVLLLRAALRRAPYHRQKFLFLDDGAIPIARPEIVSARLASTESVFATTVKIPREKTRGTKGGRGRGSQDLQFYDVASPAWEADSTVNVQETIQGVGFKVLRSGTVGTALSAADAAYAVAEFRNVRAWWPKFSLLNSRFFATLLKGHRKSAVRAGNVAVRAASCPKAKDGNPESGSPEPCKVCPDKKDILSKLRVAAERGALFAYDVNSSCPGLFDVLSTLGVLHV
jgi:hypothetical protein